MPAKAPIEVEHINRRSWMLWALPFAVVFALTAAIPLLYYPLLTLVGGSQVGDDALEHAYYAIIGLSGLILVFCLYTAIKHRELNHIRLALIREERAKEEVRTRLSELSALFEMSTSLNLQLRLDVILEIIVRRVVSSVAAQQASIMIYNPESGELETRASYGLESEFARNARRRLGEGIAGWVAQHQKAVILADDAKNPELERHFKRHRKISSALSLPLRVGERCVGVLNVNRINHPDTFQDHHRDMLNLFAEHVGAVIERAETLERLGRRSRQLEEDNLKLTQMNQMKDLFLSTASHELKTPLTSVIGYAELLDDGNLKLKDDQRSEFLRRLRGEAERLLGLIEDILDLTRLESGKMTLKRVPVSINEVARAAAETARPLATKHGVEVTEVYEGSLPASALDEVKMRQVLVNLLVNAVKFSPEGAVVTLQTAVEPDFIRVEVRDHGPGIQPGEATHIFELFGQGVSAQEIPSAGVGIGLHLVKRITELHGGHVGVNSTPGKGSTFWVRLPRGPAEQVETASAESAAA